MTLWTYFLAAQIDQDLAVGLPVVIAPGCIMYSKRSRAENIAEGRFGVYRIVSRVAAQVMGTDEYINLEQCRIEPA